MPIEKNDFPDSTPEIADALYRSGCLKFGTFKIKSGVWSPYYLDLTWLLSSPLDFTCITNLVVNRIRQIMASHKIDKLASIELKGALILPSIACGLILPGIVVRKAEKKYGLTGRMAGGIVTRGEHLLFFDDVISEGTSKLEGIKPFEELGAKVGHVLVVVDREQGGKEKIESRGYKFHALTRISELISCLLQSSSISESEASTVLDHVKNSKSDVCAN